MLLTRSIMPHYKPSSSPSFGLRTKKEMASWVNNFLFGPLCQFSKRMPFSWQNKNGGILKKCMVILKWGNQYEAHSY